MTKTFSTPLSSTTKEMDIKEEKLRSIIRECSSLVVAYSGGVDSTLVAKVAHQELGESAIMVIADSSSLPRTELRAALALAEEHGLLVRVIATDEMNDPDYRANAGNRCYFCKATLYRYLEQVQRETGFHYLTNGDQLDDLHSHRPGKQAADEKGVRSVLAEAGFTKTEVRILAGRLGLPNHAKPASPCLSSRIPVGFEVTPEKLQQVEEAETFLKTRYHISDLRVRHWGEKARIETLQKYFQVIENSSDEIDDFFMGLGFEVWSLHQYFGSRTQGDSLS